MYLPKIYLQKNIEKELSNQKKGKEVLEEKKDNLFKSRSDNLNYL